VQNYSLTYNKIFSSRLTNQALVGVSYFNQVFSDLNTNFDPRRARSQHGSDFAESQSAPLIAISGFENTGSRQIPAATILPAFSDALPHHREAPNAFGGEIRQARIDSFYTPAAAERSISPARKGLGAACSNDPTVDSNIVALAIHGRFRPPVHDHAPATKERKVLMNSFDLFAQDAWQIRGI